MHNHKKRGTLPQPRVLASAIGFAIASCAGSSFAAEAEKAPVELGSATIKGQQQQGYKVDKASSPKQTAPLLDTPQTFSVIPEALFKEQGARNLTDVLKNTPGISFNAGENGFSTGSNNFSMRGFDTSGSIFIDSARDNGSYTRDVFNLETVEVAKGPAADNGRGGAGGYINLVTKTPTLEDFIAGGVSYGFDQYDSEARKRTTLDVNQAFSDSAALRLNLMLEDSGVAGREHAEKNSWGLAPSLAFGLGTDTRAIFSYEHVENNDRPDWGVPGATVKGLITYDPATSGADRDAFYGLKSDYDDTVVDAFVARFEHDLSDGLTISNQTRWARVDRDARFTVPTGFNAGPRTVPTQTQFYDRINTSLSNLTNLSYSFQAGSVAHNLAAGLELTREKSEANRYGYNPAALANTTTGLFDPNENRTSPGRPNVNESNDAVVDSVAVYVYDTLEFNEHWQLTAGLRFENYEVDIDSRNAAGAPIGADGYGDTEFTVGGKVGLVYKPVENGSIYVSYGVSNQPPGSYLSNPDISRTGDNAFPGFVAGSDPVKSENYEIGTKWDFFDKRLSTTAALFYTEKRTPITGRDIAAGDPAGSELLKGYGKQIVKGLELSASGEITDAWNVYGGIVFMDSERKHSDYLDRVRRDAGTDYNVGNAATPYYALRTSGDELAFTPRVSGNLWTTYRLPIGLTLGAGAQHVGSSYLGRPDDANRIIPNGKAGKLPSYTLYSAMASYEVSKNVDVRLNVDNLTNEKYAASTNWNGTRASLGAPRTFLVSADFRF